MSDGLSVKKKKCENGAVEVTEFRSQVQDMFPDAPMSFVNDVEMVLYDFFVVQGNELREEENPLLIVRPLPQLDNVNGAPAAGTNFATVATALGLASNGDVGGVGVCFLFNSQDGLHQARATLGGQNQGDVAWAFTPGPVGIAAGLPPAPGGPCFRTRMITYYSAAKRELAHDFFQFFDI